MGEELDLKVTLIRAVIQAMERQPHPQKMYALIEAAPAGTHMDGVPMPLNLSLVLDRSASMSGDKIKNLRQAVHALIDLLQPADYVSVVLFDEEAHVPLGAQLAADKAALHVVVDGIQERGGTLLSLGLEKGLEEIARHHDPNRVNKIILLTDGNSWGDEAKCLELARQAGERGVPIVALGLGLPSTTAPETAIPGELADDWNHELLDQIGHSSGGSSDLIGEPGKILPVFQDVVRTAQATVVCNAELVLRVPVDVHLRHVWQVLPVIQNLSSLATSEREVQVVLGDIDKNMGKSILVELVLPPRAPCKTRIAQVEVTYYVPSTRQKAQVRNDLVVEYGAESALNAHVANVIERVSAHRMHTQALQDVRAGNIPGATQKLRQAATQLLNIGENDLAQAALQEAQNLQQRGQMSSAGTKRLSYGTRKLTQNLIKPTGGSG